MKRLVTLLFLLLFLFNAGGYHFLFWIYRVNAEREFQASIENDTYYQPEITIAIPLALPYPVSESRRTPMNAEFEFKGEHYKFVRQTLKGDTLYLVGIKNTERAHIDNIASEYSKATQESPTESKPLQLLSKIFKDYQVVEGMDLIGREIPVIKIFSTALELHILTHDYPVNIPPPKILS